MFDGLPLLSVIIWLPIFSGIFMLVLTKLGADSKNIRRLALASTVLSLLLSLNLWGYFSKAESGFQFIERTSWLPELYINYYLGVDGFSMPLIVLTSLMTFLVIISSFKSITKYRESFFSAFLIMQGLMIGVFCSLDAILFYIFFEAMLIPMFLVIGLWGGPNRVYASMKFFLYTFLGSIFLLISIIYLHKIALINGYTEDSFTIMTFYNLGLTEKIQKFIFIAMTLAFAVKIPMWPVHTWLPDAHVEAPTGGSVILAAITLKMGGYGFLRFILPIAPLGCVNFAQIMICLSLIAICYIGFVAIVQKDMKKLIAYSSISHMGFVTLGIFILFKVSPTELDSSFTAGINGAMIQMISHGFISAAMFLCVGVLYDRMHSRDIYDYGGVVNKMPIFAAFFMLFSMANAGLPGTSGFVGEFMIILSSFHANYWYALIAATTLILGASYTLWMYKRVVFGQVNNKEVSSLVDINGYELFNLSILAILVIIFGIWPNPLLEVIEPSSKELLTHIMSVYK